MRGRKEGSDAVKRKVEKKKRDKGRVVERERKGRNEARGNKNGGERKGEGKKKIGN